MESINLEKITSYPYIYLNRKSESKSEYELKVLINNSDALRKFENYIISNTQLISFITNFELLKKCELHVGCIEDCFRHIYDKVLEYNVGSLKEIFIRNNIDELTYLMLKLTFSTGVKGTNITFIDNKADLGKYITYFYNLPLHKDAKFKVYQKFDHVRSELKTLLPLTDLEALSLESKSRIMQNILYKVQCRR